MFSTKSKNLLLGKWRIDGRGNESNCSLSLSFIDEMELVQLLLSLLITSYLYVYIFHLGEIRDCRQIAFVTLNRFCMFKQKNRPPCFFLTDNIKTIWHEISPKMELKIYTFLYCIYLYPFHIVFQVFQCSLALNMWKGNNNWRNFSNYPKVKSQTGLSALRVSCKRALSNCCIL